VIIFFFQRKIIYKPVTLEQDYKFNFYHPYTEHFYEPVDNVRIHYLRFEAKNAKGVVLYFHGNKGSVNDWGWISDDVVSRGYDLIIPDYRGYGKSKGALSEEGIIGDCAFLYNMLIQLYGEDDLVVFGCSLGSAIAVQLSAYFNPKLLILESPFSSMVDLSRHKYPLLPVKWILKDQFRSDLFMEEINCPVYMIHGNRDKRIPLTSSIKLFHRMPEAEFLIIKDGDHNNLNNFRQYHSFLDEILR